MPGNYLFPSHWKKLYEKPLHENCMDFHENRVDFGKSMDSDKNHAIKLGNSIIWKTF